MIKRPYIRAADRRRQLLDATGRIFDRASFGGITLAGVAVEAGVSRQLVYDHFTDLDGLYEAFVTDRLAHYRAALPRTSTVDADTAIRASFRHLLQIPPADRRVVRLLTADVGDMCDQLAADRALASGSDMRRRARRFTVRMRIVDRTR